MGRRRPAGATFGVSRSELARFVQVFFDLGYGIDPEDVAERFGLSRSQAARALVELVAWRDIPA